MTGKHGFFLALTAAGLVLTGCATSNLDSLPPAYLVDPSEGPGPDYVIGPLDGLSVFVWRNPELSTSVTVRPDGRVSLPLINDLPATGKTSTELAKEIEAQLSEFIQTPIVTIIVSGFQGPFAQQVRIVGKAARPAAIPYRANMTLLDAMIAVGGLAEDAAGNRARLIRFDQETQTQKEYRLKIDSLLEGGKTSANVRIEPGDVILIPQSLF